MAEPWRGRRAKVKPVWLLFVNAPRTRTGRGDVEEHEAEEDRAFAGVQDREHALGRMHEEIADRHFARQDERGEPAEETNDDQHATDDFDDAGAGHERRKLAREHCDLREMQKLRRAVLEKEQTGDDS